MKYPNARLLLFAKAPVPGQVKTRLIPVLGASGAADFCARLIQLNLEKLLGSGLCPVELWCSPSIDHPYFQHCRHCHDITLHQQSGGDLGERMDHALRSTLNYAESAVLIGTDCPSLTAGDLDIALSLLQRNVEVVLGPAQDGGYYLVGLRRAYSALFTDIPWGTPAVLPTTLARLGTLGLGLQCLPERMDVDTPADYARFMQSDGSAPEKPDRAPP